MSESAVVEMVATKQPCEFMMEVREVRDYQLAELRGASASVLHITAMVPIIGDGPETRKILAKMNQTIITSIEAVKHFSTAWMQFLPNYIIDLWKQVRSCQIILEYEPEEGVDVMEISVNLVTFHFKSNFTKVMEFKNIVDAQLKEFTDKLPAWHYVDPNFQMQLMKFVAEPISQQAINEMQAHKDAWKAAKGREATLQQEKAQFAEKKARLDAEIMFLETATSAAARDMDLKSALKARCEEFGLESDKKFAEQGVEDHSILGIFSYSNTRHDLENQKNIASTMVKHAERKVLRASQNHEHLAQHKAACQGEAARVGILLDSALTSLRDHQTTALAEAERALATDAQSVQAQMERFPGKSSAEITQLGGAIKQMQVPKAGEQDLSLKALITGQLKARSMTLGTLADLWKTDLGDPNADRQEYIEQVMRVVTQLQEELCTALSKENAVSGEEEFKTGQRVCRELDLKSGIKKKVRAKAVQAPQQEGQASGAAAAAAAPAAQ